MNAVGVTVEQLAADKGFAPEFLSQLGCREVTEGRYRGAVRIEYRLADGTPAPRQGIRFALSAKEGSAWEGTKADGPIVPYGLWRLGEAREAGEVTIVEGESDCWTLWHAGFAALGIPGAAAAGCLEAAHLERVPTVYVVGFPGTVPNGGELGVGLRPALKTCEASDDTTHDGEPFHALPCRYHAL